MLVGAKPPGGKGDGVAVDRASAVVASGTSVIDHPAAQRAALNHPPGALFVAPNDDRLLATCQFTDLLGIGVRASAHIQKVEGDAQGGRIERGRCLR